MNITAERYARPMSNFEKLIGKLKTSGFRFLDNDSENKKELKRIIKGFIEENGLEPLELIKNSRTQNKDKQKIRGILTSMDLEQLLSDDGMELSIDEPGFEFPGNYYLYCLGVGLENPEEVHLTIDSQSSSFKSDFLNQNNINVSIVNANIKCYSILDNEGSITVSGGTIENKSFYGNKNEITVSDGYIKNASFDSNYGRITVSGGHIGDESFSYNNGSGFVSISGGDIEDSSFDSNYGRITVSGGSIGNKSFSNNKSIVSVSGGYIGDESFNHNNDLGFVSISGGTILKDSLYYNHGSVLISGGSLGTSSLCENCGTITISEGNIAMQSLMGNSGQIILKNGTIGENAFRYNKRIIVAENFDSIGNDSFYENNGFVYLGKETGTTDSYRNNRGLILVNGEISHDINKNLGLIICTGGYKKGFLGLKRINKKALVIDGDDAEKYIEGFKDYLLGEPTESTVVYQANVGENELTYTDSEGNEQTASVTKYNNIHEKFDAFINYGKRTGIVPTSKLGDYETGLFNYLSDRLN